MALAALMFSVFAILIWVAYRAGQCVEEEFRHTPKSWLG